MMKAARTGIIAGFILLLGFFVGASISQIQKGTFEWNDLIPILATVPILIVALSMPSKGGMCCKRNCKPEDDIVTMV
jgi:hypothetical protein